MGLVDVDVDLEELQASNRASCYELFLCRLKRSGERHSRVAPKDRQGMHAESQMTSRLEVEASLLHLYGGAGPLTTGAINKNGQVPSALMPSRLSA